MAEQKSPFLLRLPLELRHLIYDHLHIPRGRLVLCMDFGDGTLRHCAESIGYRVDTLRYSPASRRERWYRCGDRECFVGHASDTTYALFQAVIRRDRDERNFSQTRQWIMSRVSNDWWGPGLTTTYSRGQDVRESIRDILNITIPYETERSPYIPDRSPPYSQPRRHDIRTRPRKSLARIISENNPNVKPKPCYPDEVYVSLEFEGRISPRQRTQDTGIAWDTAIRWSRLLNMPDPGLDNSPPMEEWYKHRIASDSQDTQTWRSYSGLLRTCHQLHDEILPLLYGSNTFVTVLDWQAGLFNFRSALRPQTRELIRNLIFILPRGSSQPEFSSVQAPWNPVFWFNGVDNGGFLDGMLGSLSKLGIITVSKPLPWGDTKPKRDDYDGIRPPPPAPAHNTRSQARNIRSQHRIRKKAFRQWYKGQIKEWKRGILWKLKLKTVLRYLTKGLGADAMIIADTNDEPVATETIRQAFGPDRKVNFQRMLTTDYIDMYPQDDRTSDQYTDWILERDNDHHWFKYASNAWPQT